MSAQHTPGPWRSNDFSSSVYGYIFGDSQAVCRVFLDGDECEANARLIAAAPDLLEALKLADLLLSGANMNRTAVERKVRSAISKATWSTE